MSSRTFIPYLLGNVIAVALLTTSGQATAQHVADAPLQLISGRVTIDGTSNVHDYTAATTTLRLVNARAAGPWSDIARPGGLAAFEIAIPAASLASDKDGLDKNMHKALKAGANPDITFRLDRLTEGADGTLQAVGVMRIAGVERPVTLPLAVTGTGAELVVSGKLPMVMTDYGITPPRAMLGMLRTDPKIVVSFEVTLRAPQAP